MDTIKLVEKFSFSQSNRLNFDNSKVKSIPFQLLPRANYPVAQVECSLQWQSSFVEGLENRPLLSLIFVNESSGDIAPDWDRMLQAISVQAYRQVEVLFLLSEESFLVDKIKSSFNNYHLNGSIWVTSSIKEAGSLLWGKASGEAVFYLGENVFLHPHALLILAKEVMRSPCGLYYSNETVFDNNDKAKFYLRRAPLEEYNVLSYDQIGCFFGLSREMAQNCASKLSFKGLSSEFWSWKSSAWALEQKCSVGFIPMGLVARQEAAFYDKSKDNEIKSIVGNYAKSIACPIKTFEVIETEGTIHTKLSFDSISTTIQVIIPFHNKSDLTIRCLKSLAKQDCLSELSIYLVDNNSQSKERKAVEAYIEDLGLEEQVSFLEDEGYFNYARLNNRAVKESDTEFILLLNNDVELLEDNAISTLVAWSRLPNVDVVGGELFYEDRRVQHGGINFSSIRPENVTSLDQFSYLAREVSAVSFAMALIRRDAYFKVQQLDEFLCPNGFGDALFCHNLKMKGRHIFYTPFASGVHRESASRGRMPEELEFYELHKAKLPIAALYDDMQARAQPTRLPLAEIEEVPLYALLGKVQRVGWLYNWGNYIAKGIIRLWPRK